MNTGYQLARLLAYVTGLVNQELLLQVEYLAAENRILRIHAPARLRLSDAERGTLAEMGNDSGERVWRKLRKLPNRKRFSAGGASWWRRSSMVRSIGRIRGGRELTLNWRA